MGESYPMMGRNGGDFERGSVGPDDVTVDIPRENSNSVMDNFITTNFRVFKSPVHTDTEPLGEQLTRDSEHSNLTRATTYGCLNSDLVDDSCYIRPQYLRFAPHKGALHALRELLCDKWKMGEPKFLINVFGTYNTKDQRKQEKLRKIVNLGRKTKAWFMSHKKTDPMVAYYNREEAQRTVSSHRNMVYWRTWSDLSDSDQAELTPIQGNRIHTPEWQISDNKDQKMMASQASCLLFPDYVSKDELTGLRDHLQLVKEFAKTFDEDGHKKRCRNVQLHVCAPLNVFIPEDDEAHGGELSDEEKDLLAELLKSGIPTIIFYNSSFHLGEYVKQLSGRMHGLTDTDVDVLVGVWVDDEEHADKDFPHSFTDLSLGLRKLLVKSRKHGLSKEDQRMFRQPIYTELYLSMVLELKEEECKRILTAEEIRKKPGIKESLVSMMYFYKRFDLLDLCIRNNYDIKTCIYITSEDNKVEMLLERAANSITKKLVKLADEHKDDSEKRQVIFFNFINKLIGKDSSSYIDPTEDPNCIPIEDAMYIFYCFNDEWETAEIMRKYSDFSIFKCFIAIKAMQEIKRIRSNRATTDYFDVQQLDGQISKLNEMAGYMVEWSYKHGLNTEPVVFWKHPQYNYKSILDLAGETQCYKILEDKTNIHTYVTRRWNAALDPTTSWFKIVVSWITLGLLAPLLIKFVPKQSKRDETTLFLNERGRKRTILEKIASFWTSPRSKCYLLMITYLVFLYVQTLVILDTTRIKSGSTVHTGDGETWQNDEKRLQLNIKVCLVFVLCFLSVEVDFRQVTRYNFKSMLCTYFSCGYNQVDLFSAFSFLLYAVVTYFLQGNEDAYLAGKVILSISYIGYIIRFTQFLQLFEDIGPKLISIKNMLADLVFFAAFLLLTIFAYGIVSEFLLHPYPRSVPASQILDILKRPYVNMFGELDLDTLEQGIDLGSCKYEQYLKEVPVEEAVCEEYECDTMCGRFKLMARVLLGLYTMITVILLTNLLVSIFGKTYDTDFDITRQLWQLQRYKLVEESEAQCILPFPPFNLLHSLYSWFRSCPCCTTETNAEFYEHYVKEVEYRCSRHVDSSNDQREFVNQVEALYNKLREEVET